MADYPISKEAVVRELLNLRDRLGGPFAKEVLNMALARLEGFTKMDGDERWIRVEERLPDRGVEVLGTNGKAVEMCTYWPGQPTPWESWTAFHFKPTHWMPLPEPPKEAAT